MAADVLCSVLQHYDCGALSALTALEKPVVAQLQQLAFVHFNVSIRGLCTVCLCIRAQYSLGACVFFAFHWRL